MENYILHLLIMMGIYIILAMSLDIAMGYTGLTNFAHAAFYGIGAYSSALLSLHFGLSFFITFLISGLSACIIGLVLSLTAIKLRGDYLALATLGFGIIIQSIFLNWTSLTRGPLGIPGIPRPSLFGIELDSLFSIFILVSIFAIISYIILHRLTSSSFGKILKAVSEDEIAALTLGRSVKYYKITALGISAFFAGISGALYAHYITFIDPSSFTILESMLVIIMIIIGGLGSINTSVLGAIVLILLPEPLRFLGLPPAVVGALRQIIYSILLVIIILLRSEALFKKREKYGIT